MLSVSEICQVYASNSRLSLLVKCSRDPISFRLGKLQRALTEKDTKAVASIILTKNKVKLFPFNCQRDIISFSFNLVSQLCWLIRPISSKANNFMAFVLRPLGAN